jgi:hypothetical protein
MKAALSEGPKVSVQISAVSTDEAVSLAYELGACLRSAGFESTRVHKVPIVLGMNFRGLEVTGAKMSKASHDGGWQFEKDWKPVE